MTQQSVRAALNPVALGAAVVAVGLLILCPFVLPPFYVRIVMEILLFGGMALAWNLFGGLSGYWSFGHTAFVGIGAFASGLFEQWLGTAAAPGMKFLLGTSFALVVAAVAAAIVAAPILRLRGIYFAIGMLCFAEILAEITRNFDVFQGSLGISYPSVMIGPLDKLKSSFYAFLVVFLLTAGAFVFIRRSRLGMGLVCIGQDEDTAAMMGVPTERYKFIAFVISAVLTTLFGAVYSHSLGFITSGSVFRTDISLNLIVFSMLGGIGTFLGPLLGATVMIAVTKTVLGEFLNMHLLFTGLILMAIVVAAPEGLLGLVKLLRMRLVRPRLYDIEAHR